MAYSSQNAIGPRPIFGAIAKCFPNTPSRERAAAYEPGINTPGRGGGTPGMVGLENTFPQIASKFWEVNDGNRSGKN